MRYYRYLLLLLLFASPVHADTTTFIFGCDDPAGGADSYLIAGGGSSGGSTSPVIADFTNAQHTHQSEAQGGTLSANAITSGTFSSSLLPLPTTTTVGGVMAIAASGTKKIAAIGTDGVPVLADDVQPIIVHGAPPACAYAGAIYIDDTTTPKAIFFCTIAGGGAIDVATLGNAYVTVSDGTNTASAVGAEQFKFAADAGGILSPLVTAGTPDQVAYNFSSQATSNQVLRTKTTSGAQVPVFGAIVAADLPATLKSVYWDAGAIVTDGTNCGAVTNQTLNSGPIMPAFSCADSNSSIFYGSIVMPPSWDGGTVIFTLELFHGTTESITFAGDFAAQCRLAGAAIDGTYGTAVAADASIVTANLFVAQATTAVTPNGTCTAGAGRLLNWKYTVDATNFSANSANTKILGVRMSYTAAATD